MSESRLITSFKKAIRLAYPNLFFYKIPDSGRGESFVVPKPFDAFAILNGQSYCFEFKYQKKPESISFNLLRPSQVEGLKTAQAAGAKCFVVVEQKQTNGKYHLFTFAYPKFEKRAPFKKGFADDPFIRELLVYDHRLCGTGHTYDLTSYLSPTRLTI